MPTIILFGALLALCLLYSTNLFLRGARKEAIGGAIGLLIVATIVAVFWFLGWRLGLVAVVAVPILVPLVQPLARSIAQSLLGYRTGPEGNSRPNILERLEQGEGMESIFAQMGQGREVDRARLARIAERSSIANVLERHGLTFADLEDSFQMLRISGLDDLAWNIASDPGELEDLLRLRREGREDVEIFQHFRRLR
jgi:hypothetical protein